MQTLATLTAHDFAPWLFSLALLFALAWLNKRGQTGDALSYLEKANTILKKENSELKKERVTNLAEIATLKSRRDLLSVMTPLVQSQQIHEERAEERYQKTLKILDLIAARLGAEELDNDVEK